MILAGAEFAVPVGGELVVGELARAGENQRPGVQHRAVNSAGKPGCARNAGKQEAAVAAAELGACHIQQGERNRIDLRRGWSGAVCTIKEGIKQRCLVAMLRQDRHIGIVDKRARRGAAALPRALIIQVKKAQLCAPADRPAEVATENVLLDVYLAQEVIVGVERGIAEVFPNVAMEVVGSALERGIDIAAAIASLRGVVEAGRNLEFL